MTAPRTAGKIALRDVSLLAPGVAILVAVGFAAAGDPRAGIGIAVGAILAYLNTGLLIKRIRLATSGDSMAALVSIQLGLLVTFTVVGGLTVLMLLISVRMTVAMAIAFFIAQTAELLLFYRSRKGVHDAMAAPRTLEERGA